ncbi:hypothetical protein Ahia01_001061900, partial [Argonauta hians]
ILCNLYYGHMEETLIDVTPDELLMRQVDDYLFVTPHYTKAVSFLDCFIKGITEYNCNVQPEKLQINFDYRHPEYGQVTCLQHTALMPWCGWLFNVSSLEVMKDYSRYRGTSIYDTVSINPSLPAGSGLKENLLGFIKAKNNMILVDEKINSLRTIIINVYNMFYLLACRFHVLVRKLPSQGRADKNVDFFYHCIETVAGCFHQQMTANMQKTYDKNYYPLHHSETKWLTIKAFHLKLSRVPSQYHQLLYRLRNYWEKCVKSPANNPDAPTRYQYMLEVTESGVVCP